MRFRDSDGGWQRHGSAVFRSERADGISNRLGLKAMCCMTVDFEAVGAGGAVGIQFVGGKVSAGLTVTRSTISISR